MFLLSDVEEKFPAKGSERVLVESLPNDPRTTALGTVEEFFGVK
jgi:hypothetical protein